MTYVLESSNEYHRLEHQSTHPNYDLNQELTEISFTDDTSVLDAGCGSGVLARRIASTNTHVKVTGLDSAKQRIDEAAASAIALSNLNFIHANLEKSPFRSGEFSSCICRYVMQHLPPSLQVSSLTELLRITRPGGRIILIDTDGLIANLWPAPDNLCSNLASILRQSPVDLFVGRKLPALLSKTGWINIDWKIQTTECHNNTEHGAMEISMMQERLEAASPVISRILGGDIQGKIFIQEYIDAMKKPNVVYFQNKFIVTALKPKNHLKIVED